MSIPNPPRRSWFAVWHWPRWTWAVVVVLMPVAYLFTATLIYDWVIYLYLSDRLPVQVFDAAVMFHIPSAWLAERSEWYADFCSWESGALGPLAGDDPFARD